MRNYAETCKAICSYNLVYNIFDIAFAIKKFNFCGVRFKRIFCRIRVACVACVWHSCCKLDKIGILQVGIFLEPYKIYNLLFTTISMLKMM